MMVMISRRGVRAITSRPVPILHAPAACVARRRSGKPNRNYMSIVADGTETRRTRAVINMPAAITRQSFGHQSPQRT